MMPIATPDGAMIVSLRLSRGSQFLSAVVLISAVLIIASIARAQLVVMVVNGEPITSLDVEQRSKLIQLSSHKVPPRQAGLL